MTIFLLGMAGHDHRGLDGQKDVTPSDRASGPTGELASLFASPSSLASGSTGGASLMEELGRLFVLKNQSHCVAA
jgi:hypothetical protein